MALGTHSTVEFLAQQLLRRFVPKWYEGFCDPESGTFYERLGHSFRPVLIGQRRLVTQCRQLAFYSHAAIQAECGSFQPDLSGHFRNFVTYWHVPETGGWRFSVDDDMKPADGTYDLYGHAFAIFALSHYFRASGDGEAKKLAASTLQFITEKFPMKPGYAEALDENLKPVKKLRRQNPHMHLLEACLFAAEVWQDEAYIRTADEMVDLFYAYFWKPEENRLAEYYTEALTPDSAQGDIVEPGHYCEWVWLLKKHAALKGDPDRHDETCLQLLDFANRYGWDSEYGGIYDGLDNQGAVVKDTKRLWPFTEALKANVLLLDIHPDKQALKDRIAAMVEVFRDGYMQERGFWTEWLDRDFTPSTDYMPGTTPYHVYFGIMEARSVLHTRGRSKSLFAGLWIFLYALRRNLSAAMGSVRQRLR